MKKIIPWFASYRLTIKLLLLNTSLLALATFIEKYFSTTMAKALIYYSPLFFLCVTALVINFILSSTQNHLIKTKKIGFLLVHFSFILLLIGAMISHIFSFEGILHLREGQTSDHLILKSNKGMTTHKLPFKVTLDDFILTHYPGSSSPSSYESKVTVTINGKQQKERIYMNNVLDLKGYRFFQASFDEDEKGTVLSVNYDKTGRLITYTAYFFLFCGFFFAIFGKQSRFYQLRLQLSKRKKTAFIILGLCLSALTLQAKEEASLQLIQKNPINKEHAAQFGALPMLSTNGRIIPINTFASQILRKIHKSTYIAGMDANQFLLSLLSLPAIWQQIPFIVIPSKPLAAYLHVDQKGCSYAHFFDKHGRYTLQQEVEEAYNHQIVKRSKFEKDLLKLDEQINTLHQLFNYQMIKIFPLQQDSAHRWFAPGENLQPFKTSEQALFVKHFMPFYITQIQKALHTHDWNKANESVYKIRQYQLAHADPSVLNPKRIAMEVTYNQLRFAKWCRISYLICGGCSLFFAFLLLFKSRKELRLASRILFIGIVFTFLFQTLGLGLRWYIAGNAPWSNSYETMVYVAWATVIGGFVFIRHSQITFSLATLFAGIILFVSGLSWMDPQINPLVPVLRSPWLMFHVAIVVSAYSFFGISTLLGLTNLSLLCIKGTYAPILHQRVKTLTLINEMSMWIGLALMTIGTFLGAIWANESWGNYWGWDPKETWAIITVLIYVVVTHLHLLTSKPNTWLFNTCSVLAFYTILMTYFGVNFYLSGMHSYAKSEGVEHMNLLLISSLALIFSLIFFAKKRSQTKRRLKDRK